MLRKSNTWLAALAGRRPWTGLALLLLALATAACTKGPSNIGVGLPSAQANTGAYLVDTITVRASTILRDSVVTSSSSYMLVGRATDAQLGAITATSAFQVGLGDTPRPDATFVYDSVVLVLNPTNYRYGDTTKTQALLEVHQLNTSISTTKPSLAFTPVDYNRAMVLNKGGVAPQRRARPNTTSLRLPLDDAKFGRPLLAASQAGQLTTQEQLDNYLKGLALVPAASDNATLLLLNATASTSALLLYYHDPLNASTALNTTFSIANRGLHFFQVQADRSSAAIRNLPTGSLKSTPASLTGEQTVIEGAIGLQTKLEFPYLTNLLEFGSNLTITSAQLSATVPVNTLSPYVPTPPPLQVSLSDAVNRPAGTYNTYVPYTSDLSSVTGVQQGSYTWSVDTYIQGVLGRSIPNNGMLLSPATNATATQARPAVSLPEWPSRVVLGSPRNTTNRMQLRLYLIQVR